MDEFGRRNLTSTPPEFGVPRDRTRPPSRTRQQTSQAERAQPRTRQNSNQRLRPDEEHDLARLQADLEAAQTSKQEVQNKYSLLKSAYKTIKSTLQDSAIHAADLEQQLSFAKNQAKHGNAAQNELARLNEAEQANARERSSLRKQLERLERERNKLIDDIHKRDELCQHLQSQMETLVADRESSQDRSTAIRVALEGKLDVIMRELQNTEGECSKARAQLEEAERAQQSVAEKHALDLQRQEEAIESLRGALEAAQSTSRDLDKELQQSKAQKDDVVRQHEASSRALQQSSQNSSERLEARITSQTTSLEKYQQTIDDLHQSQKAATKVAQDHQRGLEAALEEAKKDLQHSRSQYESSEAERTKQTQSSKDQLEKMRLRTEEIEKTRADLQRRLDETERGKQATNRDLNNLRESTDKTINRLTSELNATKDLLARERETREEFSVEHKADSQEWQHQLQEVREELKASKASLARETGVTERLKTDMHKLETHFKSTTEDRDRLHTLALERKQTIDRQTGELAQQATKIQSLHSEVEHHSKGIEEHQQRVHDLETQATSRSEQLQRLEVREKQLADSATAWETKHAETSAELTRARSHLEENASEIEKLRSAVDSAKEDTATARVASQRDTISLARERMRRQQVARDGHAAVQLVQDKIGEQSNFVDQLTTQASITRQLQHTLDQRSLELDASRQQTSKLQTQLSLSVQKSSRLKASRDACLRTTQFLLKSLRDHAERTSRLYAHRRSSQNQSSEVQLQIRSFTDQFRKDIQVLRGVAVKSQNMWKQKHIELLETRTQFAEVKAQMGQLRTSEAAASMMLAQERSKRKKALDNAALLSDRFKLLNKSATRILAQHSRNSSQLDSWRSSNRHEIDTLRLNLAELEAACQKASKSNRRLRHELKDAREFAQREHAQRSALISFANSLKDKQQSVLATLDAFLQSRPTPAAEARNMNGGLAPSATLPPHYLSEIHVVWKQLAPTMAWLFSKIASLRRVKPPIQAIQQQLQPVTPRCTAAAQTDPQKGMHDLQSALDRARSETQRIETFWRISLLDLAQAIDVCKALQGKLDARDKSLMPRQHFKSDALIDVSVQASLPLSGFDKATQTDFESATTDTSVCEAAVMSLSRCCLRLQTTLDDTVMQCSNLNERLDTSQKALKDHEEANSRAQVESLQFRQRLEELERRQLPSTSTPYLDKLSNAHAVACNVLESCRVIAGHSALQPAQLDLSLMDRLTSTLEDIRRYVDFILIDKKTGGKRPLALSSSTASTL